MRYLVLACLLGLAYSCNTEYARNQKPITEVVINPILKDTSLSIRALEIGDEFIFYGSKDHIGKYAIEKQVKISLDRLRLEQGKDHFKYVFTHEDRPLHFRAIAEINGDFLAISIENPAKIYRLARKAKGPKLVYEEFHNGVFYDAMAFWNGKEGVAVGDPIDGCMSILITRDAGHSWNKLSCDILPEAIEGEAAFAASDTNISISGDFCWIATGGVASRILFSKDKGQSWESIETPVIQGQATTGLYSIDFYDNDLGFGIGGDYTNPNGSTNNKIITTNGGRSWRPIASGSEPGYRSCVQFIPKSNGKELVVTGYKGIDYSSDSGETWIHLSDEGFYTIRFVNDTVAYAGGNGKLSQLIFR